MSSLAYSNAMMRLEIFEMSPEEFAKILDLAAKYHYKYSIEERPRKATETLARGLRTAGLRY